MESIVGHSYLIHVAGGPALREGEVNGDILSLVVAPAPRSIVAGPVVVEPVVEGSLVGVVAVIPSLDALDGLTPVTTEVGQVERQEAVSLVGHVRVDLSRSGISVTFREPDALPGRLTDTRLTCHRGSPGRSDR